MATELLEHIYSNLKKFIIISQSNTSGTYIGKQQNISQDIFIKYSTLLSIG